MERLNKEVSLKKRITQSFYELFFELFEEEEDKNHAHHLAVEIFLRVFTFIQISTLLWSEDTLPSDDPSMVTLFNEIGTIRIEGLSSRLGILIVWIYIVIVGILLTMLLLLLMSCFKFFKKNLPQYIKRFLYVSMLLFDTVFSIPAITVLLHCIYKFSSSSFIDPKYNFNMTSWLFALALTSLIFIIALNLIWILFNFSSRHNQPKGKVYPSIEILSRVCNYTTIVFHVFLLDYSPLFSYFIVGSLHTFVATLYVKFLPNYNKAENLIDAAFHSSIAINVGLIVICKYITGGYFAAFGFFTILPVHIVIIKSMIEKKMSSLEISKIDEIASIYDFELIIRSILMKNDENVDVIGLFTKAYKILNGKCEDMFFIWESYYCLDLLKDERLALVKLLIAEEKTIHGDFQVFKCKKHIGEFNLNYTDLAYVQCQVEIGRVNTLQQEFFDEFTNFLFIVPNYNLDSRSISKHSSILKKQIVLLTKRYNYIICNFPEHFSELNSYSQFVQKILGDSSKAKYIEEQLNFLSSYKMNNESTQDFGIIISSAENKDLGSILFMNKKALEYLDANEDSAIGSMITDFIPEPFKSNHGEYLGNYAKKCKKVQLDFPIAFFMLNQKGFLIEICMYVCICGINGKNVYYFKFKKLKKNREIVLLNSVSTILAHSELISYYLSIPCKNLVNCNLPNMLNGVDYEQLKREKFLIHKLRWVQVSLTYIELPFRTHCFYIFFLSENLQSPFDNLLGVEKFFEPVDVVTDRNNDCFCEVSGIYEDITPVKSVIFDLSPDEAQINRLENPEFSCESLGLVDGTQNIKQDQSELSIALKRKPLYSLKNLANTNLSDDIITVEVDLINTKNLPDKRKIDSSLNNYENSIRRFKAVNKGLFLVFFILIVVHLSVLKVFLKIDSDNGSINTLGEVLYNTGSIISRLRLNQLSILNPEYFDSAEMKGELNSYIKNLTISKKKLSQSKNNYLQCKPIEVLYSESLVVNELNGKFKKINIVDYLNEMIKKAEEYEKFDGIEKNSSNFLEENFFGSVKNDISKVMNGLTVCIENNTTVIESTTAIITIIKAILLFLYILVVISFLRSLDKSFLQFSSVFYEKFEKKNKRIVNFCNNILDKDKNFDIDTLEYPSELSKSIKSHHFKSFLFLILPVLTLICIYSVIASLYTSDLSSKIKYHPILKVNLLDRKAIYNELYYYSIKSYIANYNITELISQENFTTTLKDYESIINSCIANQKNFLKIAQKSKYRIFTSSYNKKSQFYSLDDPDAFFALGSLTAGRNIVYDMLSVANSDKTTKYSNSNSDETLKLLVKIHERNDKLPIILDLIIKDLDSYSNAKLDSIYNELLVLSVAFTVILFIIILVVGQVFLNHKSENFKNLKLICTIMMNN